MKKASTLNGILSPFLKHLRIKKIIKYIKPNSNILDIGCDEAYILKFIKGFNYYLGIDINSKIIEYNKTKFRELKNVDFSNMDIETIESIDKKFNIVILAAVIEHIKDFNSLLEKLYDLTTEDGLLIITTPTKKSDRILKIGAKLKIFSKESLDEHEKYFGKEDFLKNKKWEILLFSFFEFFLNQLIILKKK